MAIRRVSEEEVGDVTVNLDSIEPNPSGDGVVYAKVLDSRGSHRLIECVVDDTTKPHAVVTVMVTDP